MKTRFQLCSGSGATVIGPTIPWRYWVSVIAAAALLLAAAAALAAAIHRVAQKG